MEDVRSNLRLSFKLNSGYRNFVLATSLREGEGEVRKGAGWRRRHPRMSGRGCGSLRLRACGGEEWIRRRRGRRWCGPLSVCGRRRGRSCRGASWRRAILRGIRRRGRNGCGACARSSERCNTRPAQRQSDGPDARGLRPRGPLWLRSIRREVPRLSRRNPRGVSPPAGLCGRAADRICG